MTQLLELGLCRLGYGRKGLVSAILENFVDLKRILPVKEGAPRIPETYRNGGALGYPPGQQGLIERPVSWPHSNHSKAGKGVCSP